MCKPKQKPSFRKESISEGNITRLIDQDQGGLQSFTPIAQGSRESAREWLTRQRGETDDWIEYLDDWILIIREPNRENVS